MENKTESDFFIPIEKLDNIDNSLKAIIKKIEDIESVIKRYKAVFYQYRIKISMLDLSVRSINCLKAADITYLDELTNFNKYDLLRFRYFGKKCLSEIEDIMKEYGLKFKDS